MDLPFLGKKLLILGTGISRVDQQNHSSVGLGSNDSTRGLEHADQSGKAVSIVESWHLVLFEMIANHFPFQRDSWKSHSDDGSSGETIADKVDAYLAAMVAASGDEQLAKATVAGGAHPTLRPEYVVASKLRAAPALGAAVAAARAL